MPAHSFLRECDDATGALPDQPGTRIIADNFGKKLIEVV
jgi:hypothetical protein